MQVHSDDVICPSKSRVATNFTEIGARLLSFYLVKGMKNGITAVTLDDDAIL